MAQLFQKSSLRRSIKLRPNNSPPPLQSSQRNCFLIADDKQLAVQPPKPTSFSQRIPLQFSARQPQRPLRTQSAGSSLSSSPYRNPASRCWWFLQQWHPTVSILSQSSCRHPLFQHHHFLPSRYSSSQLAQLLPQPPPTPSTCFTSRNGTPLCPAQRIGL